MPQVFLVLLLQAPPLFEHTTAQGILPCDLLLPVRLKIYGGEQVNVDILHNFQPFSTAFHCGFPCRLFRFDVASFPFQNLNLCQLFLYICQYVFEHFMSVCRHLSVNYQIISIVDHKDLKLCRDLSSFILDNFPRL